MLIPTQFAPVGRRFSGARSAKPRFGTSSMGELSLEQILARFNVVADPAEVDCECTGKELKCMFIDDGGGKQKVNTGIPCGKNVRPTK